MVVATGILVLESDLATIVLQGLHHDIALSLVLLGHFAAVSGKHGAVTVSLLDAVAPIETLLLGFVFLDGRVIVVDQILLRFINSFILCLDGY